MSAKYDPARDAFGAGKLSWTGDRIVAQLVSAAYVFNPGHTDRRDLKGAVGEPVELTGKSLKKGWAKAASFVFKQVSGPDAVAVVFRREAELDRDCTLIAYHDKLDKFPMKLIGGDVHIDIPEQGIFRI